MDELTIVDNETGEIISDGQWFERMVTDCKDIIGDAVYKSRRALVEGYHALGKRIVTDENYQEYAKGNKSSVQDLARNIDISERTLYYAVQFCEKFPIIDVIPEDITWNKVITKLLPRDKGMELDAEPKSDQAEMLRDSYGVESGQVWLLGNHRLICGNCYDIINKITSDAVITDPPYGIDYKPEWNKWNGDKTYFNPIIGDNLQFDPTPFLNFGTVLLFGANYFSNRLPLGGWLCWDKRTKEELDSMFGSPFELAWYRSEITSRKSIMIRIQHGGVINADSSYGNNEKRYHATQKPIALMREIIDKLTSISSIIFDPFAGSGSTLLACERSGRKCISVEIDPNNVAVIIKRWSEITGETPCVGISRIKIQSDWKDWRTNICETHSSAANKIYRRIFCLEEGDENIIVDKQDAIARYDYKEGIDVILTSVNGTRITIQEKFLTYWNSTITFEEKKTSGEKGVWYYCTSQYYFVGYTRLYWNYKTRKLFDVPIIEFQDYILVDLPALHRHDEIGEINWDHDANCKDGRKSTFKYIHFDNVPSDCIIARYEIAV